METQLTETLTATTRGVENTQQHVVALRSQLENAHQRIAQLESALASTLQEAEATNFTVVSSAPPEQSPSTTIEEPVSEIQDNESSTDIDSDANWYDDSLTRKNAS